LQSHYGSSSRVLQPWASPFRSPLALAPHFTWPRP
jgi:hypothetical protein